MKRTIGLGFGIGFNFRPKYPPSGGTPTPTPPNAVGELDHRYFTVGTGPQTFSIASGFSGSGITYSITSAPSGADLAINPATGVITAQTDDETSGNVTVRATNSEGFAGQTFPLFVTVPAEYTVLAREENGTVTVESLAPTWVAAVERELDDTITVLEAV